jgi:hypothetical protein
MCFSAAASFAASGGLGAIGAASFPPADKAKKLVAAVPFVFALQQLLEGFQWLLAGPDALAGWPAYGFLFIALVFWPTYVPYVAYRNETKRRSLMRGFVVLGGVVSLFLFVTVLLQSPITVELLGHSLDYEFVVPFPFLAELGYLVATCGSLLCSSRWAFRFFGAAAFFFAVISGIFFYGTFVSVWCFFAAILSGLIYFYIRFQHLYD